MTDQDLQALIAREVAEATERAIDLVVSEYNKEISSMTPGTEAHIKKLKHSGYAALLWGVAYRVKEVLINQINSGELQQTTEGRD